MKRPRLLSVTSLLVILVMGLAVFLPLVATGTASAMSTSITEYPVPPTPGPFGICQGPDGNLWFTVWDKPPATSRIDRITPSGVVTEFTNGLTAFCNPYDICSGPGGNLWFTESGPAPPPPSVNRIGKINPSTGAIVEYPVPTLSSSPHGICVGPDGNIWFTESAANKIGVFYYGTGTFDEFDVPTANSGPEDICVGPDDNLWFTERNTGKICKVTIAGAMDSSTEYAVPAGAGSNPYGICVGPDDNLWFTENNLAVNMVGSVTPSGVMNPEYAVPTANSGLRGICVGPDENLWFTEYDTGKIGSVTTSGVMANPDYPVPAGGSSHPNSICTGPDDNLWFTEFSIANSIGKAAIQYSVNASAPGGHGAVSPDTQIVNREGSATVNLAPDPGYHVAAITDNGVRQPVANPYVINNVEEDHNVVVDFRDTYVVTASVSGGHGTVAPDSQAVNPGGTATVNIAADPGYRIATITDNGVQQTVARPYVIENVNEDHDVVVTFTINTSSFYFAEGTTRTNFAEYLCIGNSTDSAATANVTYMFSDGSTKDASYNVPRNSRLTVNVNAEVGAGRDVSIRMLSNTPNLVAERPLYFNYNGVWTGGSDALGAVAPNKKWYFAEGNTLTEFDEYVTVLNPGGTPANLIFHYMIEGTGQRDVTAQVGPNTRATFKTRDQIGNGKNESLYLESSSDVVAERPMYFNYLGLASNNWTGGHDVVGTNSPARDWYFAEGTTRKNSTDGAFEEWLCLQNPGSSAITVNATYQLGPGQGTPVAKSYIVPAQQRLTVSVNREIGQDKDDSVRLTSTSDFIAERPMYFSYHSVKWTGGHNVMGANSTGTTWFFAEGTTRTNFEEWLCMQNSGNSDAHTTVSYYTTSGQVINKSWTVKANTRLTVSVNTDVGANQDISAKVISDNPIIVERPMYFNFQGVWNGGHDVVGFVPAP